MTGIVSDLVAAGHKLRQAQAQAQQAARETAALINPERQPPRPPGEPKQLPEAEAR